MKNLLYLIILSIISTGCATHYQAMSPAKADFQQRRVFHDVKIQYQDDYLSTIGDARFHRHSVKENIHAFAVEVSNEGLEPIILGETHLVSFGGQAGTLLENNAFHKGVKFRLVNSIPTLLISPLLGVIAVGDQEVEREYIGPILFLIGPILISGGIADQAAQNYKLKQDLQKWNLYGRRILPGETVSGILGLRLNSIPENESLGLFRIEKY